MAGAPQLTKVLPLTGGAVLVGALAVVGLSLPPKLRDGPTCDDVTACASACKDGNGWACSALGGRYLRGEGVARNPPKALELFETACAAGDGDGCFHLTVADEAEQNGAEPDAGAAELDGGADAGADAGAATVDDKERRMFAAYQNQCDQGLSAACYATAQSHESGAGTPVDPARANALYTRVRLFLAERCDAGSAKHCSRLGLMHQKGISVPPDMQLGLQLLERSCELGHGVACALAGHQKKNDGELVRAAELLTRACELERVGACAPAAELTEASEPKLALYERRATLYADQCEGDYVESCWTAANIFVDPASFLPRDEEKARAFKAREIKLREQGCDNGATEDCESLASTFEMGKLVERDMPRAQKLLARACTLGSERACKSKRETLDDVVDASIGYHTCVVKSDGTVWCWGQNRDGQLGDGTKTDRDRPVQARGVPPAVSVDLYGGTTCVRTVDDEAWCWGAGFGKPARVDSGEAAREVAAGFDLACALRDNGDVGCSGYDAQNLELGASAIRVGGLQRCAIAKGELLCWGSVMQEFVAEPKAVLERKDVADASVTSDGFCALFKDGTATCKAQMLQAEPVTTVNLKDVRMVGGDANAGCAMKGDDLWCWHLREGELKEPFQVAKLPKVKKLIIRSLEGCALTSDKALHCWYVFNPEPELVTFQTAPSAAQPN